MLVSSANSIGVALCNIAFGKSLMYRRKRSGPKTNPRGTPCFTLVRVLQTDLPPGQILHSHAPSRCPDTAVRGNKTNQQFVF